MTLAVILLNIAFILSTPPSTAAIAQTAPQSATPDKPADTTPEQGQETAPAQQNPPAPSPPSTSAPPSATPAHSPATPNRKPKSRLKKRVLPPNCIPAPEAGTPSSPSDTTNAAPSITPADPAPAGAPTPPTSTPASATTNCPPKKVIVRQGGTSEPSIQLAGGPTGAHERDTATQMLQSAEANLKRITGSQLTSSQKDMVTQIRQFMDQSKTATTAGDIERARTLAWKAQLLSEELVNPPK